MFTVNRLKSDGDQKIGRLSGMIKLFYQNKDFTTAKNYVNELLLLKPDSSEAYKLLSQINEAMGEHDQAMQNYKKSLDLKVNHDLNSSFENNYQFTPTKISSPVVNKANHAAAQENNVNQVSCELEKLFQQKTNLFEKSFENLNQQLVQLNENFNKNYEEVSSFKKKVVDMNKKLTSFASKQDEIITKLSAFSLKEDDQVKKQLATVALTLANLSNDNSKIIDELYSLKDIVTTLRDLKSDLSNYDEESYNDDDETEQQENQPANFGQMPKLNELFKADKDSWKCSTCDTPNSKSDPTCVCCETPNPNVTYSKPQINGFEAGKSGDSPFKFGVGPSAASPKFNFGTQPSQGASPAFPAFSNDLTALSAKTAATTVAPNSFPSFGSFSNPSSTLLNSSSVPANLPISASGNNFNISNSIDTKTPVSSSFGATFASFSNNSSTSVTPAKSTAPNPTSSFSFNNTLNSLKNEEGNNLPLAKTTSISSTPFSFASTFSTSSASTFTNTSSSRLDQKTTGSPVPSSTNAALSFPSTNSSLFSFNSTTSNSNSLFANSKTSPGHFSFGNVSFSNNLFSQKPNFLNNETQSSQKDAKESPDKEQGNFENGGDPIQDGDYFKLPEVKMPENYEQVTGEEEETTIFEKRAKLHVFKNGEYKERGVGIIKILKHNETLKYRVLMRRDHIFKVCLNTHLSELTNLELVDNKFLRFTCIDFSEDKPTSGVFLLKFGNVEFLSEFKKSVESLRNQKTDLPKSKESHSKPVAQGTDNSDIQLVYTKQPKAEHLENIATLKLPVNFYDYEDKEPCKGCIGCKDEAISWNDLTQSDSDKADVPQTSNSDLGLFSSIATDLNLTQNKVDSIAAANENLENDHVNDQNFVSEKSKLLPENYEAKTGEEEEDVIFNERGKMFHFINEEWKERGIGFMKILNRKNTNSYRLLMRRDRILNVICNHKISTNLKLTPFQNSNNTLSWFSKDYSEEPNGTDELFALKFKNEVLMNQFEQSVNDCIQKTTC